MRRIVVLLVLLIASGASANPMRDGANHHLGDASFVARFGRTPGGADTEKLRMRVHLEYVRELLAARDATSPELAGRRAELLGYLGDYIAAGTTPQNTFIARRNPVFIDADGRICAVGYLIERSVGRELPEAIAASHRLDYLEDIATAMPEVAAWVETSGLTLAELASIQPGYEGPEVQFMAGGFTAEESVGSYSIVSEGATLAGKFKRHQMTGTWTRTFERKVLGKGTFVNGAGTWTSFRVDGSKMAHGAFTNNRASGTWRFFHPSGRLAATGALVRGQRHGAWTFFYDVKGSPKLATVDFKQGFTRGGKHFDLAGKLAAVGTHAGMGIKLDVEPRKDGVRHQIHQGIPAAGYRLDGFYLGNDRVYVRNGEGAIDSHDIYDGFGRRLAKQDGKWIARDCKWPANRKRAAANANITRLHELIIKDGYRGGDEATEDCGGKAITLASTQGKRIETMLASRLAPRGPIPAFDFAMPAAPVDDAPSDEPRDEPRDSDVVADSTDPEPPKLIDAPADDLVPYLTSHMNWYIEWPHVDDTFLEVYRSLPGYGRADSRD